MENPLSRGGHTQVAAFGAFSKTGGRRGGCVLFGHRASRAQPQQLSLLSSVIMHFELEWGTPVYKLEFC